MDTYTEVTYEVIDPVTRERFLTGDRFIAETHYEKSCIVNETHTTVTKLSQFAQTRLYVIVGWTDEYLESKEI